MKIFEKWIKEQNIDAGNYPSARDIWKSALKEALKHETDNQSTEIGDWIRKELSE